MPAQVENARAIAAREEAERVAMQYEVHERDKFNVFDNDADNFDPTLNSSSAEYFRNNDTAHSATMNEDRWKSGGGIQGEDSGKIGGGGLFSTAEKTRDADGTIDRVKDPPKELLPLLYRIRTMQAGYNIKLEDTFVDAGGTAYGTIAATRFGSTLVNAFPRAGLTNEELSALAEHYGVGNRERATNAKAKVMPYEYCSWMDLCEDVNGAKDVYGDDPSCKLPKSATQIYGGGVRYTLPLKEPHLKGSHGHKEE